MVNGALGNRLSIYFQMLFDLSFTSWVCIMKVPRYHNLPNFCRKVGENGEGSLFIVDRPISTETYSQYTYGYARFQFATHLWKYHRWAWKGFRIAWRYVPMNLSKHFFFNFLISLKMTIYSDFEGSWRNSKSFNIHSFDVVF